MVCHGEHTYLYSQAMLHVLSQEVKGGANIKRLSHIQMDINLSLGLQFYC